MRKQIVIHTILIEEKGQRIHDQIILPHSAKRITGVHFSLIMLSNDDDIITDETKAGTFFRNHLNTGDMRLQVNTPENWFYNGVVTIQDRNLHWGDAGLIGGFFPHPATHLIANHTFLSVDCNAESGIVQLYYRDRWALETEKECIYKIRIYLEVELEPEKLCS
jgi:hypothetical protein